MLEINIPWLRYLIEIEVQSSLMIFDFMKKGYHLRTMIETAIKRQFPCNFRDNCLKCKEQSHCEYVMLFHPQILDKNASSKFVILPHPGPRLVFKNGETLTFEIRLFGDMAQHRIFSGRFLPAIEYAGKFSGLGKWRTYKSDFYGRFAVRNVYFWDKNSWHQITMEKISPNTGLSAHQEIDFAKPLEIQFITPVLLNRNKKNIRNPDFFDIIKGAERRIQTLIGTKERLTTDKNIRTVETRESLFSTRQIDASRKEENYIIGRMGISHIPDELQPIIGYSGLTHVGKGVSMGMGGFVVQNKMNE
jgi:hypothetical protein